MIPALEVKAITNNARAHIARHHKVNNELYLVEQEILKAAKRGYDEIGVEFQELETIQVLEDSGYKVRPGEDCKLVSW